MAIRNHRQENPEMAVARALVAAAHTAHQAWPDVGTSQRIRLLTSAVSAELAYLVQDNPGAQDEYLRRVDDLWSNMEAR